MYNTHMNIYLSEDSHRIVKTYLINQGHRLCEIRKCGVVYDAIASHADIFLCKIGQELMVAKEQYPMIKEALSRESMPFTLCRDSLGSRYPDNIKYNAVQLGSYFIHNTAFTASDLMKKVEQTGLKVIPVKQGYTKCSLVVVDEQSVITSDEGLARSLEKNKIDTLLISHGHVELPGFPYGFLGGASGRVGNEIIFHGDLSRHPDFERIKIFIEKRSLSVTYFKDFPLKDIGSVITGGTL